MYKDYRHIFKNGNKIKKENNSLLYYFSYLMNIIHDIIQNITYIILYWMRNISYLTL